MSDPIVMHELDRTEVSWHTDPDHAGLLIEQANPISGDADTIWIPSSHVPAFISAIQRAFAKR